MINEENEVSINLVDFWDVLIKHWKVILAAGLAAFAAAFLYLRLTYVPAYTSTATLYVLRQDSETSTTSDFQLSLNVMDDCTYFLKSHDVVDKVIDNLSLDLSYSELRNAITTNNPSGTRILNVSVEADSPENAKKIVDKVCEIGQKKITDVMGFQQVNFAEMGTLNTNPSNKISKKKYVMAFAVVSLLVYLFYLIRFFLSDKLRGDEDIENYLGLTIMGDIPDASAKVSGKYGYGYGYYGNAVDGKNKKKKKGRKA